jgi:ABC-type Fe3+-siderophore transport system permease subunit
MMDRIIQAWNTGKCARTAWDGFLITAPPLTFVLILVAVWFWWELRK